jgi:DNA-binding HxlR family transcriptional regulator
MRRGRSVRDYGGVMGIELQGALALRQDEPLDGYCPMDRALAVVGTHSAVLILREAFYGATRFDEFQSRTGLTAGTTADRLRELVASGILLKRPYQEPGQRQRHEYVLTAAGEDLLPVLVALLQWANRHDPPPYPPQLQHRGCGEPVLVTVACAAGHEVGAEAVSVTAAGPFGVTDPEVPRPAGRLERSPAQPVH